MSHHVDRFGAALTVLAGHGHIKQRLIQAFEQHLAPIDDATLPTSIKDNFLDLRRSMTQVEPLNGEGSICASVRKMSIHEAEHCARRIVGLYGDVIRLEETTQESLPPAEETGADVPAMLLKTV